VNAFLARVVEQKQDEVTAGRHIRSESALRERCVAMPPCRDLAGALIAGPDRIIAEVKKRSPSVPRFRRQEDPSELARLYADAGAAALSLVTDRVNFGTGPGDVRPMRGASALPLVAKDFVIDPWQLLALRAAGADAVLLIARLLPADQLAELHEAATELGLDTLVECHDEDDVAAATAAGARLVGINNRDLDSFTVSLETSRRLLPALPSGCVGVVESGIAGREEIVELQELGARAFLIGGSLLQSEDPAGLLRQLRGADRDGREVAS
jgi:indole-3-glycerol phosphate synthase